MKQYVGVLLFFVLLSSAAFAQSVDQGAGTSVTLMTSGGDARAMETVQEEYTLRVENLNGVGQANISSVEIEIPQINGSNAFTLTNLNGSGTISMLDNEFHWVTEIGPEGQEQIVFDARSAAFSGLSIFNWNARVFFVDGSMSNRNVRVVILNDDSNPSVKFTSLPAAVISTSAVEYRGDATDLDTAISKVEYRLNAGDWETATLTGTLFRFTLALEDGSYAVEARATDAAGNPSNIDAHTVRVDTTSPSVTVVEVNESLRVTTNENTECKWDTEAHEYAGLSNSLAANGAGTSHETVLDLAAGTHALSIVCKDAAGNIGVATASITVAASTEELGILTKIQNAIFGSDAEPETTTAPEENQEGLAPEPSSGPTGLQIFSAGNKKGRYTVGLGEQIAFSVKDSKHTITVQEISTDFARFVVQSEPQIVRLAINEERNVDVNEDGTEDVLIKLSKVADGKAIVDVKVLASDSVIGTGAAPAGPSRARGLVVVLISSLVVLIISLVKHEKISSGKIRNLLLKRGSTKEVGTDAEIEEKPQKLLEVY